MSEEKKSSSPATGKRTRLGPSEKYEIFINVLSGQATQREAAEKFRVDRSVVIQACRVAKQGALDALAASVPGRRPSKSPEQLRLEQAETEIERLKATITEQAVELYLHQGKSRWD